MYHGQIFESAIQGTPVLTVEATDGDMANTSAGYGDVMYSLSGESMALFTVNSITGEIVVSNQIYQFILKIPTEAVSQGK